MKTKSILLLVSLLAAFNLTTPAKGQTAPPVDCNCVLKLPQLQTNACLAYVPDLCLLATSCFSGPTVICSQTPVAGTPVGPGTTVITLWVTDSLGMGAQCVVPFVVTPTCTFALLCATNKTVECGSAWTFDPPTWTNNCSPPAGTLSNGVVLTVISTVTNGTCPMIITRTWMGMDDCGNYDQCSQQVTVVDTTPPVLTCACITNSAVMPVILTVTNCQDFIPDLCLPARSCAFDACGPLNCLQTPPAGTPVGPGVHPITVTVYDCASNSASCTFNFTVISPVSGPFALVCAPNKTVQCGTAWNFNPPTPTNACCASQGLPNGGVTLTSVTTVTNGFCPQVITRTWIAADACGSSNQCSQTVTVVDTTPPVLDCNCLTNPTVNPVPLTVIACSNPIPALCQAALVCATDNCGPLTCSQSPAAGTMVGPGTHPITITVTDCASNAASCVVNFSVIAPAGGCTTNPCVTPPWGMVAWWPLDETTGATIFVDATGNGHTAIVESGGPVGSGGSPYAVAGKVAGANYFYGLSPRGRALNTASLNFNTNSFSVDCWVNPVQTGPIHWHPIVDKLNQTGAGSGFGYAVGLLNSNVVLKVGAGPLYTYTSLGSAPYAAWSFVAVVVDRVANTVTFHVNGVTEPPQPLIPAGSFNSGVDLLIGSTWNGSIPLGELAVDELELFNRTLTTSELNSLWIADSLGKCKTNTCLVSIFCPSDIVTNRSCTQTCATVTYPAPAVANGALAGCTPPSGSCFALGTTLVTCTATNICGQPAMCGFSIVVNPGTNCYPCDYTLAHTLNTGTTPGGALLPTGAFEPLWVNTAAPGGPIPLVVADTNVWPIVSGPWLPAGGASAWVSPDVSTYGPAGWYTNRWTFDAPCTNVCLRGRVASDDDGYLFVNGVFVTGAGFTAWSNVNHCANFAQGLNMIEFVVHNAGGPTGIRTELEIWTQCCCPSQTNVWNSGMIGPDGNLPLPATAPDPNYTLVSAPPGGCTSPAQVLQPWSLPGVWVPNSANSQWIGAGPTAYCQGGVYHYRLAFYLPCTIGASIVGQWTADDWAGMSLNGLPTGNRVPSTQFPNISFAGWHPVKITNGFVCGNNYLDFYVTNAWTSPNPTGLRAQLTNVFNNCCTNCTPQPCACNFINGDFSQSVPVNGTGGGWTSSGLLAGYSGWQAFGGNPGGTFLLNNVGATATDPTISQTLCCLVPGQCYTIRGQRKVQVWYGQTAPSFAVLLDGAPILTLPVPTNPADTNWHAFSVSFTATNTCQTIGFAAEWNGTDVSYWLDNIRLECCNPNCAVSIKCPKNLVLLTCNASAIGNYTVGASGNTGPVICTPPSGSSFPLGTNVVICTATNICGADATCSFTVLVKRPPNRWDCWWQTGLGISHATVGGATTLFTTTDGSPDDAPPTLSFMPDPGTPNSGLLLQPGPAQAITFTTLLDFTAPVGAGFDLVLPPDPAHPNQPPILSLRNKGKKGYCVKSMKFYDDDPSAAMRAYCVNSNGNLLDPITFTFAEIDATGVFDIGFQPGVSNCHVTIELNLKTGAVSVEIPGPIALASDRKGWDGCIYGPDRPVKKPTSRVTMIPPRVPGLPPITDLYLYASGVAEVPIEEPSITAKGKRWGDGHVTLMKAYDDGDSVEFMAGGDGGGVHVDLGHTESFNLRLTKFETNLPPGEDLLTRTIGPIRGLTNRPPPPVLDSMLLHGTGDGVECSVDFNPIDSPTVRVLIYNGGTLVYSQSGVSGQLGQPVFTLPEWPSTLGKLGGRTPCRTGTVKQGTIRFPGGAGFAGFGPSPLDVTVVGDEFRIVAELADDAPRPDYYSGFEFVATEGADWGVSDLQRNLICTPVPMNLQRTADGLTIDWSGEGFRLQGAVDVTGPWFDLGAESPVSLGVNHPARFFRLVCD